jgi:hypothetical protein
LRGAIDEEGTWLPWLRKKLHTERADCSKSHNSTN